MAPSTVIRLTSHPETSPTSPIQLLKGILFPFWILTLIFFFGLPRAIWDQLTSLNPFKILSPFAWRDAIWGHGSPPLLKISDTNYAAVRRQYLSQAYGKVLEVGAGSGELIKYYDQDKVSTSSQSMRENRLPPTLIHLGIHTDYPLVRIGTFPSLGQETSSKYHCSWTRFRSKVYHCQPWHRGQDDSQQEVRSHGRFHRYSCFGSVFVLHSQPKEASPRSCRVTQARWKAHLGE